MIVVRGTKKFLDRVGRPEADPPASTSVLGDWYVNVLFWRRQVALFVNASTFVPVFVPLAPAGGVLGRFPAAMAGVFGVLGVDPRFVHAETVEMGSVVLAKTASRQVLGVMNEFAFMAEHTISTGHSDPDDLLGLSVWLAGTIVGPISRDAGSTPLGVLERVVAGALAGG